ncbi:uncharacterized protein VICG_02164, partial [Vittaforma corneae ATCC 50505]
GFTTSVAAILLHCQIELERERAHLMRALFRTTFISLMKIFVSHTILPDKTVVSDDAKERDVDLSEPIQLVFVDGKVTIRIFKQLYLAGMDAHFVVKNLEQFIFKMRLFRNLEIKVVDGESPTRDREPPKEIVDAFGAKNAPAAESQLDRMIERYVDDGSIARGVELSFRPRIFEAIRSSLENSELYKSKATISHKIFGLLKGGKKTIHEIETVNGAAESVHRTLKSMVYSGIVVKKGEHFLLSEIFC